MHAIRVARPDRTLPPAPINPKRSALSTVAPTFSLARLSRGQRSTKDPEAHSGIVTLQGCVNTRPRINGKPNPGMQRTRCARR